jgi:diaminohydroxyphosphoribosylaminopyrimidine deaminase / 5-amino-6-(5-phosphoribosylamino)uracil reductase
MVFVGVCILFCNFFFKVNLFRSKVNLTDTKNIMITGIDLQFLMRCFDLARLGMGATSPNPCVGSVIVASDGRIIGEGFHQKYGEAHAEVNAVASVKPGDRNLIRQSTIYVSLEPCHHIGKTKPCVDLILREQIPRVIIAAIDPFPQVAGKSIEKLKQHGVEVHILDTETLLKTQNTEGGILTAKNLPFSTLHAPLSIAAPFFTNVQQKRPYIILKWAESSDGFIGRKNEETPISNVFAKRLTHKWRSEADAIMVGSNTARVDNPELTNRHFFGKSPVRVVIDRHLRLSSDLKLFDGTLKTFVYTEENSDLTSKITHENVIYRPMNLTQTPVENILNDLFQQNIGILFVEGGQRLLQSFINAKLWDEARVFHALLSLHFGVHAPQLTGAALQKKVQVVDNQLFIFRRI